MSSLFVSHFEKSSCLLLRARNNGKNQRVVSLEDVEEFLGRGWSFVARLSDEKAILKIS
jgi:hypothetical protein